MKSIRFNFFIAIVLIIILVGLLWVHLSHAQNLPTNRNGADAESSELRFSSGVVWNEASLSWGCAKDFVPNIDEIITALKNAVRIIGNVNQAPSGVVLLDSLYRPPPKPSQALRNEAKRLQEKADRIEQDEKDLKHILEILNKLERRKETK
jgi:hypothetical protein